MIFRKCVFIRSHGISRVMQNESCEPQVEAKLPAGNFESYAKNLARSWQRCDRGAIARMNGGCEGSIVA